MNKLLEVRQVTKRFGGLLAVDGLTMHVNEGESLGLIGPNGAGKTTIFNLIMNELHQTSGEIYFDGKEISKLPTYKRVNMGVARTYQVPRPFGDMTVTDNIRVGMMPNSLWDMVTKPAQREDERKIGESVGFGQRELSMLPGELSMGDLRRLELARTLAARPKLLLLDEVFAGLSLSEIGQISELLIEKRKQGLTYIIVSHDLRSLAPLVDRVVVMSFGSTIAEGSFDDVLEDEKVQQAYLGH